MRSTASLIVALGGLQVSARDRRAAAALGGREERELGAWVPSASPISFSRARARARASWRSKLTGPPIGAECHGVADRYERQVHASDFAEQSQRHDIR